jgi:hypothetical protein
MHDIWAEARSVDGDGDPLGEWGVVPGRHKTVSVPAEEIADALAQSGTGAKVQAYKQALASNLNTQPEALAGWDEVTLEELMDSIDLAVATAQDANDFILSVAGEYPVHFSY